MNTDSFDSWLSLFLIRGVAIGAIWLLAGVAMRKLSASKTSAWWRSGLLAMLAVIAVPADFALIRIQTKESPPVYPAVSVVPEQVEITSPLPAEPLTSPGTSTRAPLPVNWRICLWLGGAAVLAARLIAGCIRVKRITSFARPLLDPAILEMVAENSKRLGLRRPVALKTLPNINTPYATGLLRPTIVLPEHALTQSLELNVMIRHELAHFARADVVWQLVAETVVALHWLNPLAWLLKRQLRLDQESAADDLVLTGGTDEVRYAALLFEAANRKHRLAWEATAVPMARPSTLRRRIGLILDATRDRGTAGAPEKLTATALACLGAVAIGFTSVGSEPDEKAAKTWSRRYHDTFRLEKPFADRFGGSNSEAVAAFHKELEAHGVPLKTSMKFELSPDKKTLMIDFAETDRGAIEGKMSQLMIQNGWWRDNDSVRKQMVANVLNPLRTKAAQSAAEMARIRQSSNLVDPDPENYDVAISSSDRRIIGIELELREKSLRVTKIADQLERIKLMKGVEIVEMLRTIQVKDHTMEKMQEALQEAFVEEVGLKAAGIGEKHPRRRAVRSQIEVFQKTMEDAATSLKQSQLALLEVERRTLAKLQAEFEEAKAKQVADKVVLIEYLKAKKQYIKDKKAYEAIRLKYEIEGGDQQGSHHIHSGTIDGLMERKLVAQRTMRAAISSLVNYAVPRRWLHLVRNFLHRWRVPGRSRKRTFRASRKRTILQPDPRRRCLSVRSTPPSHF